MNATYSGVLVNSQVDGSALTAAAAATAIPAAAKFTFPANYFDTIGKAIRVRATGRISNAVTTPGTARFDLRLGGTVIFDGLAVPLNLVAKTNVPFELDILLTCRAIGASANFMGQGKFTSESVVGSPLPSAGGSGAILLPYNTAPAVGSNVDSTTALQLDMFFTQTAATGSMTVHQYVVESLN